MEKDARGKAAEAIERRARQREAAALAQAQLTPEAIAAEEERQRKNAGLTTGGDTSPEFLEQVEAERRNVLEGSKARQEAGQAAAQVLTAASLDPSPPLPVDEMPLTDEALSAALARDSLIAVDLSAKLAEAVQPVLDASEEMDEPEPLGVGRAVIQWILVPSDDEENEDGYQLGLQVQVDEQSPGGVVLEITTEMLERWKAGVGLQKNRTEHKRFAAGIIERASELAALETGNALIWTLEQLMSDEEGATDA